MVKTKQWGFSGLILKQLLQHLAADYAGPNAKFQWTHPYTAISTNLATPPLQVLCFSGLILKQFLHSLHLTIKGGVVRLTKI